MQGKKTNSLSILQILPSLESGGVERGTIDIALSIKEKGFKSYIASSGGMLTRKLHNSGVKHINLPLHSKSPFTIYKNIKKLVKIINEEKIDILHARSRAPAWSGYFAAKKTGCKFITTWHGTYNINNNLKRLYNSIMGKGTKIIAVSNFIKEHIIKNYPNIDNNKIEVIQRGTDTKIFDPVNIARKRIELIAKKFRIEYDQPIILLPGRITSWKGHLFLLDALKLMKNKNFLCLFVGKYDNKDNYFKKITSFLEKNNLTDKVRIFSNIDDMPALYMISDIVVSASIREEAFGRIATEAQAMERILVATNHGGACETVIDKKTGFLVDPKNPQNAADILDHALSLKDEQYLKITKAARKHICSKFSLDKMKEQTIKLYEKL